MSRSGVSKSVSGYHHEWVIVTCKRERDETNKQSFWSENQKGRGHLEDPCIGDRCEDNAESIIKKQC